MNADTLAQQVPDRISRPIVAEHLEPIPAPWRKDLLRRWFGVWKGHQGNEGARRRAANLTLLDAAEKARAVPGIRVNADDDELCDKASRMAERCERAPLDQALQWAWSVAEAVPDGDEGAMRARLACQHWWRRQLRRHHGRSVETLGARLHLTRQDRHLYVTHAAVSRRRNQRRRNRRMLEELLAVNEAGQSYTLAELSDLTVSNPVLRRGELMCRMAGFETVANEAGHVAEFWTLTAPSRFHPSTRNGPRIRANPVYDGSTPRDAQAYLSAVWAKVRAAWNRAGIRPYGFRIAEPHHDGCPHWHLLLFVPADQIDQAQAIAREKALADTPDEPGAQERRFVVERIDRRRGTAAGYVAKYVAKNIDGFGLDAADPQATDGAMGRDPGHVAERVDAWASTWGIRQFQQVGGPGVTVWRELRRLDEQRGDVEAAREAADRGDWAGYVRAMGGADCPKDERPVQLALWEGIDEQTGEIPQNRYGEQRGAEVCGVQAAGVIYVTRLHTWTIGQAAQPSETPRHDPMRQRRELELAAVEFDLKAAGAAGRPRSPVNNCTGEVNDDAREPATAREGGAADGDRAPSAACGGGGARAGRAGGAALRDCPARGDPGTAGPGPGQRREPGGRRQWTQ